MERWQSQAKCTGLLNQRGKTHVGSNPILSVNAVSPSGKAADC